MVVKNDDAVMAWLDRCVNCGTRRLRMTPAQRATIKILRQTRREIVRLRALTTHLEVELEQWRKRVEEQDKALTIAVDNGWAQAGMT